MTPPIEVKLNERIITLVSKPDKVVSGTTYSLVITEWDDEWANQGATVWDTTYARVWFMGQYYDFPFNTPSGIPVTIPTGVGSVDVGFYRGELNTSNAIRLDVTPSILDREGNVYAEFTGEMYNAWAEGTSELLCDDSFDGTSPRPVKNSVLTAWKNTVPLDSALVHKTGDETVAGAKTFTGKPTVKSNAEAYLDLVTNRAYNLDGYKSEIRFYDQKDGVNNPIDRIIVGTYPNGGYNYINSRLYSLDRSSAIPIEQRTFSDHGMLLMQAYYPVDGSGNPQALTANAFVTSGNIAVDPRIVHTTGNETIAGAKKFTSRVEVSSSDVSALYLKSPTAHSTGGTKSEIFFIAKGPNGEDVTYGDIGLYQVVSSGVSVFNIAARTLDGTTRLTAGLRCANDGVSYWIVPSYRPVDGQGVHLAPPATATINSDMLAIDPRVVHTTGAETVAGNKTLTGRITVSDLRWGYGTAIVNSGDCCKFYEVTPAQYGTGAEIRVYNDYDLNNSLESRFVYAIGGSPSYNLNGKKMVMNGYNVFLAKRASDGVVEVWLKNIGSSPKAVVCEVRHIRGTPPTVVVQSGSEPVVGDTYSAVHEIAS